MPAFSMTALAMLALTADPVHGLTARRTSSLPLLLLLSLPQPAAMSVSATPAARPKCSLRVLRMSVLPLVSERPGRAGEAGPRPG